MHVALVTAILVNALALGYTLGPLLDGRSEAPGTARGTAPEQADPHAPSTVTSGKARPTTR